MSNYAELLAEHASLPAFRPFVSTDLLKPVSFLFLSLAFILSFYFTTIPARGAATKELAIGTMASLFGGFGLVCAFCAVGVNV